MVINFDSLSNQEVRDSILQLRKLERKCEVDLLLNFIELEKRDLALSWGYSSLFKYLVNALGYSEACASRRVRISRLIGKYPEIVGLLKTGSAYYAPSSAAAKMVQAIATDSKEQMPVCALVNGEYGINDVYLGVPAVIGAKGVESVVELDLSENNEAATPTPLVLNRAPADPEANEDELIADNLVSRLHGFIDYWGQLAFIQESRYELGIKETTPLF